MFAPPFPILYEDNHLLAVVKPAMLPTMGVPAGVPNLLEMLKDYLRKKYDKPGNVYLGVVSRLDAPVPGVVLLARTSKAAARLSKQFRDREVEKTYLAIVSGRIEPPAGRCEDWICKDERHRRVFVVGEGRLGAQKAQLSYRTIGELARGWLLEIRPRTGRKHQIRVQLSHRGHPVLGDRKYGSRQPFPAGIGLLARHLAVPHPVREERVNLIAPVPPAWRRFGITENGEVCREEK